MELDALRLVAGLVHAVPGASARFARLDGEVLAVDRTADADVDPCTFRQVLVRSGRMCTRPRFVDSISHWELGGSLERRDGGVYAGSDELGAPLRWFASLLSPPSIRDAIADEPAIDDDRVSSVTLSGDGCLGVTICRVELALGVLDHEADELSLSLLAPCLVAELEIDAQGTAIS
ncbi:MAG: hypothetical protein AAGA17_21190 [Actinomycetota bacterium]